MQKILLEMLQARGLSAAASDVLSALPAGFINWASLIALVEKDGPTILALVEALVAAG